MRTAFGSWFNAEDVHDVAFPALKARQRATPAGEVMALRDVIRIAHVTGRTDAHRVLIGWLYGRVADDEARAVLRDVDDFLTAQAVTIPAEATSVIRARRVPWEFLPSTVMKDPRVSEELIGTIGMTALIRNLARMTRLGTLGPFTTDATSRVVARLTSRDALAKARIHPMDVYLALKAYQSGSSQPDPRKPAQTWHPVPAVSDALEVAYDSSFAAAEPTGRKYIVAVDSSGSMSRWSTVVSAGSALGPAYEIASTIAVMPTRLEGPNVHVIDVDTRVHPSKVTRRTNLRELATWQASGGGTDMSLPFTWALQQRAEADGFLVITDNESWAGNRHPVQSLAAYRRSVNPAARVIVVGMTATGYSMADPGDPGVLNVAGLDGALPKLIAGFFRS
jgi:60 kDa SS-A/Ro ribonucleoprotein